MKEAGSQILQAQNMDKPTAILAALALSAIGALFYNLLPLYLGIAQDFRQLDTRATGLIGGAFFLGYNVVTISAFFWIRRVNWRRVCLVCAPVAAAALYAGTVIEQYSILLMATIIAGGAFAAIYGIGTTAVGDTSNPSRWYGVKIAGEAGTGALLFLILPGTLIAARGFEGLVLGMILAMVLLIPLALGLPGNTGSEAERQAAAGGEGPSKIRHLAIWLALAGTLLFFSGQTTMWAFVERLGNAGGFDPETVGVLLSVSLLFAVSGSLVAAALGYRFGNVLPFAAGCGVFFCALLLLTRAGEFTFYAIGACSLTFSVGMGLPFAVARVAELDLEGRYVVLTVPAIGIGAMLGPSIAGALAAGESLSPILAFSGACVFIAVLLVCVFGDRRGADAG
jgi:predicted MFS family arabinose efflux permease